MFYFWGVILDLDKYIIPWQGCFIWVVILDSSKYSINLAVETKLCDKFALYYLQYPQIKLFIVYL
jgi:hypothetical protein